MDFPTAFMLLGLMGLLAILVLHVLIDHYDRKASTAHIHGLLQENRRLRAQLDSRSIHFE